MAAAVLLRCARTQDSVEPLLALAIRYDAPQIMSKCADWLLSPNADAVLLMSGLDSVQRIAVISSRTVSAAAVVTAQYHLKFLMELINRAPQASLSSLQPSFTCVL